MGRKINSLTNKKAYQLCEYLDERRAHAEVTSARNLAAEAEKALKFHVTESNVNTARRVLSEYRDKENKVTREIHK